MTIGKSFDTHGPLGPWLVTPDELGDPHDLALKAYVGDELRQDGSGGPTADLDAGRPAQGPRHRRTGWASLCVMGHEPQYPSATLSGPAEILTESIGHPTAAIAQRITRAAEPPDPLSDQALAEAGRVILAINVDRVTAANYISEAARQAQS